MNKKLLNRISSLLFIIGVILALFTSLSILGLILIVISVGLTTIQILDVFENKAIKTVLVSLSICLIIAVIIFIVLKL